jgi:hypothetical protein
MEFSPSESELYQKIIHILLDREAIGTLKEGDVSQEDIHSLLKSEKDDLSRLGLDLLSHMPSVPDARNFADDEQVAGNFLRFFLARERSGMNSPELRNLVYKTLQYSVLLQDYHAQQESSIEKSKPGYSSGKSITVLVHGTWSNPASKWWSSDRPWWWEPYGNFWNYINSLTGDVYAGNDYYRWSGDNNDKDRIKAASELVSWCKGKNCQRLRIIAHSHGGNVAMYASQLGLKIDSLILLGTPIRVNYIPNFSNIRKITNVFSIGDGAQQFGTWPHCRNEGRTLADSDKVLNFQAMNDGRGYDPDHSDLHAPLTWTASKLDTML